MEIIFRKTEELIPYVNNSRLHSENQIKQIASSIKEFGFTNPVLIDKGNGIIAGHGRVMAGQLLKLKKIPCIELSNLSEAQKKAYIIADNKIALNSTWDYDKLKIELEELNELDYNLGLIGFSADELNSIMKFDIEDAEDKEIFDKTKFTLIIDCANENELSNLFYEMQERGLQCKIIE